MEDNKLRILKMLENGLITVEEAKELLENSSDSNVKKEKSTVSGTVTKAKELYVNSKPKVKNLAVGALNKISEVTKVASQKLQEEKPFTSNDDKKFFVVNDVEVSEEKNDDINITVE